MECDSRIRVIFPYRDRNWNHDRSLIFNPYLVWAHVSVLRCVMIRVVVASLFVGPVLLAELSLLLVC